MGVMVVRRSWRTVGRATKLASWRLGSSGAWKLAVICCVASSLSFVTAAVVVGSSEPGQAPTGIAVRASLVAAWLAALCVGWWCAGNRAATDRDEGIVELAMTHGLREDELAAGRMLASTARVALLVGATCLPVLVASVSFGASPAHAALLIGHALGLAVYATAVGLVGGALACACGMLAPHRGRSLFAAIVLIPWALEGALQTGRIGSLPSVLGALAQLVGSSGGAG